MSCVMIAVAWFAPPSVPLWWGEWLWFVRSCPGTCCDVSRKLSSANDVPLHAAACDPLSNSICVILQQPWSFLRASRSDKLVSCQLTDEGCCIFLSLGMRRLL